MVVDVETEDRHEMVLQILPNHGCIMDGVDAVARQLFVVADPRQH